MKIFIVLSLLSCGIAVGQVLNADCPAQFCTADYQPVCATFTRTFSNACQARAAKCSMGKQGYYLKSVSSLACDCSFLCTADYNPVCASNGNVYSNECALDRQICTGARIGKVSNDNCPRLRDYDNRRRLRLEN